MELMELSKQEVEKIYHTKMRNNQILLWGCVFVSLFIFMLNRNYAFWAFILAIIAAINLPNINKCKEDLAVYKKNALTKAVGEIKDFFSVQDGLKDKWIIFLKIKEENDAYEFLFDSQLDAEIGDKISIEYTPNMKVPIRVIKI